MEILCNIKEIFDTEEVGASNFKKRVLGVETIEQYPQNLGIEFVQDKCAILDNYKVGEEVTVHVNLRGRIWTNPEGVDKYFNTIQGWKIEKADPLG